MELPAGERAEIARQLVESLPVAPIPEWHLSVLRGRLAEADSSAASMIPWEDVEAELWPES